MPTIERHMADGRAVHVLDEAVSDADLLRAHTMCRMLPFTRIRYGYHAAAADDLAFDYQWVHPVADDERALLPLVTMAEAAARCIDGDVQPGRVHINCITPGERRHRHIDGARDRVYVAVLFANRAWDASWAGDLTFFADGQEALRIAPRPGRIVVFDGSIVHLGGVPTLDCPEVRYAIAHKFLRAA
jgi:hypothetical protein